MTEKNTAKNIGFLEDIDENNCQEICDEGTEQKVTSPGQLQDVTMDNYSVVGYRSPCISLQHNGTTSPGQGRSVREFEEQMAALKKENFNLRLRIYFLEEKLSGGYNQMSTPEGQESLMKQYIDNKVETEILLKDVDEKQKLLMEAAQAMTHMENIQKDTQNKNQEIIDELNQRIQFLEMENKELEKVTNSNTDNFLATPKDINSLQRIRELEGTVRQFEEKNEDLTMKIQEFQEQINEKTYIIQDIESKLKELNFQNAELQEQFENKEKDILSAAKKSMELNQLLSEKEALNNKLKERNEILLKENNNIVKNIENRNQDIINQNKCLEERKLKIQQQQDLMNDMHSTILNKRKQIAQITGQLEKSEIKFVEFDKDRKLIQKENLTLKNIIIDLENKKNNTLKGNQQQTTSTSQNNIFSIDEMSDSYLSNPLLFANSYPAVTFKTKLLSNETSETNSEYKLKEKLSPFQNPSFYFHETKNYHELKKIYPREKINNNKYFDFIQENNNNGHEKISININRTIGSISKAIIKNENNNSHNNKNSTTTMGSRSNPHTNIVTSLFVPSNYFNNLRGSNSDTSLSTCYCSTTTSSKNTNLPSILKSNNFFDKNCTGNNFKKFTNPELLQETLLNHEFKNQKLRNELHEYKVKLADKICHVDELEDQIKKNKKSNETACQTIQKLMITIKEIQNENERIKKNSPENISQAKEASYGSRSTVLCRSLSDSEGMAESSLLGGEFKKIIAKKDLQITKLEEEIKKTTSHLQSLVNNELWEKNRAIECLTNVCNQFPNVPSLSSSDIISTEQLQQSFTDSDYSVALEQNKLLQKKINNLLQNLNLIDSIETIKQLKLEIDEAKLDADQANKWRKECSEGCTILTQRLEELAGFLDSLLQHKDVLNALASDRRRAMRKAIDRSLDLSRSLNNMSMSISGLSLNESSLIQLSSISGILASSNIENKENKTFNSHEELNQINSTVSSTVATVTQSQVENLKAQVKALRKELEKYKLNESAKKDRKSLPMKLEIQSESEAWSEPDRNVSFARIGLEELNSVPKVKKSKEDVNNTSTASETDLNRRSKSKTLEKINLLEDIIIRKDNKILEIQCELVEADNRLKKENLKMLDINRELNEYRNVNELLETEIAAFKNQSVDYEKFKQTEEILRQDIFDKTQLIEKIQEDRDKLNIEARVASIQIESLKKEIDELKQKHEKNLELLKDEEKIRFNELHKDLQNNLEDKLREQESKHQEYLQRDWISRKLYEDTRKDLESVQKKLSEAQSTIDYLNENEVELKTNLIEHEKSMRSLKKLLDESTLVASKAVLERTKATNEKLKLEDRVQELTKELETTENEKLSFKEQISHLEETNNHLNKKLLNINISNNNKKDKLLATSGSDGQSGYTSEEIPNTGGNQPQRLENKKSVQRLENSSPDLGIESDPGRICIAEVVNNPQNSKIKTIETQNKIEDDLDNINGNTDTNKENNPQQSNEMLTDNHECSKVFQENVELRHKLKRTRRQYEDTLKLLRTANQKKEQVERDIRQQLARTHVVLKNVKNNIIKELELEKKD